MAAYHRLSLMRPLPTIWRYGRRSLVAIRTPPLKVAPMKLAPSQLGGLRVPGLRMPRRHVVAGRYPPTISVLAVTGLRHLFRGEDSSVHHGCFGACRREHSIPPRGQNRGQHRGGGRCILLQPLHGTIAAMTPWCYMPASSLA
jgi:hypothetical protein